LRRGAGVSSMAMVLLEGRAGVGRVESEWSGVRVEWSPSGVELELERSWSEVLSCYCWTAGLPGCWTD